VNSDALICPPRSTPGVEIGRTGGLKAAGSRPASTGLLRKGVSASPVVSAREGEFSGSDNIASKAPLPSASGGVVTCQCCGQVIPPKVVLASRSIMQRIYDAVQRQPRTTQFLIELLWPQHNAPGNPKEAVHTRVYFLNKRLAKYGIAVRSPGRDKPYRVVRL